jgi:hypothetical protein
MDPRVVGQLIAVVAAVFEVGPEGRIDPRQEIAKLVEVLVNVAVDHGILLTLWASPPR